MSHRGSAIGTLGLMATVGFLSMFKTVRVIILLVTVVGLSMFCWDKFVTQTELDQSQYSFKIYSSEINDMGGVIPPEAGQRYQVDWEFKNKSSMWVQTFEFNGELYRCPDEDTPIDQCYFITDEAHRVAVDLKAGRSTRVLDTFNFYEGSKIPGVYKARFWIEHVVGDSDRKDW